MSFSFFFPPLSQLSAAMLTLAPIDSLDGLLDFFFFLLENPTYSGLFSCLLESGKYFRLEKQGEKGGVCFMCLAAGEKQTGGKES